MSEKVLMKGNEAVAEAAVIAGCRHYFGYPITPQNEIAAYMSKRMPKIGGVFLQAESEIAAINMVIGSAAAGKRSMTSSSSPGIALKSEGLSYLAGCDLPAVLVNIQRGGPGLGGIQPSQADYFLSTRSAGHGDFHMLVFAPNNIQEMFDFTYKAFDLSDKYRMTCMILSDGILGQMMEPVDISPKELISLPEKDWAVTGTQKKRKRNIVNSLFIQAEDLEEMNIKRYEKYQTIIKNEALYEEYLTEDADVLVVAYGAVSRIARNAVDAARSQGIKVGLFRPITVWPFPKEALYNLSQKTKCIISSEMSMGQMIEDVELATKFSRPILSCTRTGGVVPMPEEIVAKIQEGAKTYVSNI